MKKLIAFLLSFFLALSLGLLAEASDTLEMNRKMGYFDNTRTVLLLPSRVSGNGGEAASYVNREMKQIFRYPYYRTLDTTGYEGAVSPKDLPRLADESGADIVVMPVIQWHQWISIGSSLMMATILSRPGLSWIFTAIRKPRALCGMIGAPILRRKTRALPGMCTFLTIS